MRRRNPQTEALAQRRGETLRGFGSPRTFNRYRHRWPSVMAAARTYRSLRHRKSEETPWQPPPST